MNSRNGNGGDPRLRKLGEKLQQGVKSRYEKEAIQERSSGLVGQLMRSRGLKGFKRGGKVKKTGPALLHKGERVLTKKQAKSRGRR